MSDSAKMLDALHQPDAYPWPVESFDFVETHTSWVFLAGDQVIKLKRPVQYSFVDYSTLEKRHLACLDEVRLNRLLADDVYLGVVPILQEGNGSRVGDGKDEGAVEWATLMRRLDADALLDVRLRQDSVPSHLGSRLADRLVQFHMVTAQSCRGSIDNVLGKQLAVVTDNLAELEPFRDNPLPSYELEVVNRAMRKFIADHDELLRERINEGWIREGHGDLRCEHVSVPERGSIQVYDCVEFNLDLRCADVASDLAFLLMDLWRLDAPNDTIQTLLKRYEDAGAVLPMVCSGSTGFTGR